MNAGEKFFVTGGTGFIGNRLIRLLLDKGYRVKALVRAKSIAKMDIKDSKLELVEGDLSDSDILKTALEDCSYLFHLAGLAKPWAPSEKTFFDVNVEGTRTVLEAARAGNIKRLVYTSTAGILAPSDNGITDENTPRTLPFITVYERSKSEAEALVKSYANKGLETIVVNPPRVYGPGKISKSNAVTEMIDRYVHGHWRLTISNGESIGNYTYIHDVVQGHYLAMKHGIRGERYILGGHNLSYNQFFHELREVSGVDRKLIHVPLKVVLLLGQYEKWKAETFGKPPLITPDWIQKYYYDWALSSQKAQDELGYEITPLKEAFQETIDWLRERRERGEWVNG